MLLLLLWKIKNERSSVRARAHYSRVKCLDAFFHVYIDMTWYECFQVEDWSIKVNNNMIWQLIRQLFEVTIENRFDYHLNYVLEKLEEALSTQQNGNTTLSNCFYKCLKMLSTLEPLQWFCAASFLMRVILSFTLYNPSVLLFTNLCSASKIFLFHSFRTLKPFFLYVKILEIGSWMEKVFASNCCRFFYVQALPLILRDRQWKMCILQFHKETWIICGICVQLCWLLITQNC